jgi:hypothetical protein
MGLVALLALGGCSSTARLQTDDVQVGSLAKQDSKNVEVYSTADAGGKPYEIIGQVVASADAGDDAAIAVDKLKEEAAALGADAVVQLRLEGDMGYWNNAIKATATAVKLKRGTP